MAIGWAMLFDILDGRIARLTKTTTEIGIQLDSIADVVSFGLAPAMLVFVWAFGATLQEGSGVHKLAWFLCFMYLMCGGFRLARFNVQASRPRVLSEGAPKVDKKNYIGLPIPAAGGLIGAIVHFAPAPLMQYEPRRAQLLAGLAMGLVGLLSFLMVSTIKFSSFKTVGARVRSMRIIILCIAMGGLIYLYSRYVLLILVTLYILNGLLSRVAAYLRPHREHQPAN
jgi:CDP-diacylglycerol--serine O-phosphatidyltransferase